MGQSLAMLNPTETVRSTVLDPLNEINHGMIAWKILDLPGIPNPGMTQRVRPMANTVSLEPGADGPGLLSCTLRVRDPRRKAGRADRQLFSAIDGARNESLEWPHRNVSVNVEKRLDGMFKQSIKRGENAIDPDLELDNFNTATNDHNIDLNTYVIDRFTRLSGDTASEEPALSAAGWQTRNWTGLSYAELGESTAFADDLHKTIAAFRLGAFGRKPNVLYMGQPDFERLQRDKSLRGLFVTGDPEAGIAAAHLATDTLSDEHVYRVMRAHFGLTVKVQEAIYDSAAAGAASGSYGYQWTEGRMWLGIEGPVQVRSRASATPQVTRAGGAFALFHNGLAESGITEEGVGIKTHRVYAIQSFVDLVPVVPEFGMILYNMVS